MMSSRTCLMSVSCTARAISSSLTPSSTISAMYARRALRNWPRSPFFKAVTFLQKCSLRLPVRAVHNRRTHREGLRCDGFRGDDHGPSGFPGCARPALLRPRPDPLEPVDHFGYSNMASELLLLGPSPSPSSVQYIVTCEFSSIERTSRRLSSPIRIIRT